MSAAKETASRLKECEERIRKLEMRLNQVLSENKILKIQKKSLEDKINKLEQEKILAEKKCSDHEYTIRTYCDMMKSRKSSAHKDKKKACDELRDECKQDMKRCMNFYKGEMKELKDGYEKKLKEQERSFQRKLQEREMEFNRKLEEKQLQNRNLHEMQDKGILKSINLKSIKVNHERKLENVQRAYTALKLEKMEVCEGLEQIKYGLNQQIKELVSEKMKLTRKNNELSREKKVVLGHYKKTSQHFREYVASKGDKWIGPNVDISEIEENYDFQNEFVIQTSNLPLRKKRRH